jgi:hypothetical protein
MHEVRKMHKLCGCGIVCVYISRALAVCTNNVGVVLYSCLVTATFDFLLQDDSIQALRSGDRIVRQ